MTLSYDDADLQNAVKEMTEKMPSKVVECLRNACLKVEADAKNNCPKATGELRRSIQTEVNGDGQTAEGIVGTNCDYAIYVHEGTGIYSRTGSGRSDVPWTYYSDKLGHFVKTSGIHSTPFLENAMNTNRSSIVEYFKGVI